MRENDFSQKFFPHPQIPFTVFKNLCIVLFVSRLQQSLFLYTVLAKFNFSWYIKPEKSKSKKTKNRRKQ